MNFCSLSVVARVTSIRLGPNSVEMGSLVRILVGSSLGLVALLLSGVVSSLGMMVPGGRTIMSGLEAVSSFCMCTGSIAVGFRGVGVCVGRMMVFVECGSRAGC
jgi:hypothetical protein